MWPLTHSPPCKMSLGSPPKEPSAEQQQQQKKNQKPPRKPRAAAAAAADRFVLSAEEEIEAERDLNKYYYENLRQGIALMVDELANYCRGLGLARSRKQLADMRLDYEFMAVRQPFRRPSDRQHVGPLIDRLGVIMVSQPAAAAAVGMFLLKKNTSHPCRWTLANSLKSGESATGENSISWSESTPCRKNSSSFPWRAKIKRVGKPALLR